jgi:hypothetical protein
VVDISGFLYCIEASGRLGRGSRSGMRFRSYRDEQRHILRLLRHVQFPRAYHTTTNSSISYKTLCTHSFFLSYIEPTKQGDTTTFKGEQNAYILSDSTTNRFDKQDRIEEPWVLKQAVRIPKVASNAREGTATQEKEQQLYDRRSETLPAPHRLCHRSKCCEHRGSRILSHQGRKARIAHQ